MSNTSACTSIYRYQRLSIMIILVSRGKDGARIGCGFLRSQLQKLKGMCEESHVTSCFVLCRADLRKYLLSADVLRAEDLLVGSELLLFLLLDVSVRLEANVAVCDVGYTLKPDARPRTLTEQERTSCDCVAVSC